MSLLAACQSLSHRSTPARAVAHGDSAVIYVIRRSWHIDVGLAASDLNGPLTQVGRAFTGARYLTFGFGDRAYLLSKGRRVAAMLEALTPGPGLMLVTGLIASPQAAFGGDQVVEISITAEQLRKLQAFIWSAFQSTESIVKGPYEGSIYFASRLRYSAFHTCNTWAAQALGNAGLPVQSFGVEFASQLWPQVRALEGVPGR